MWKTHKIKERKKTLSIKKNVKNSLEVATLLLTFGLSSILLWR